MGSRYERMDKFFEPVNKRVTKKILGIVACVAVIYFSVALAGAIYLIFIIGGDAYEKMLYANPIFVVAYVIIGLMIVFLPPFITPNAYFSEE